MKICFPILAAFLLTGCTVTVPLTWATENEAYPGGTPAESTGYSANASRQAVLNYSFEDVFSSAESGLAFAQINMTNSEKASGTIFGTRSSYVGGFTKKFFYLVKVEEQGPEKTKLSIYSKQQQSGKHTKYLPTVFLPAGGIGVLCLAMGVEAGTTIAATLAIPVVLGPLALWNNINTKKGAELKWSPDDDESLDRVMSFIRTDLIQKNN